MLHSEFKIVCITQFCLKVKENQTKLKIIWGCCFEIEWCLECALDSVPTKAEKRGNGNLKTFSRMCTECQRCQKASVLYSISNSLSLNSVLLTTKIKGYI